ncbi:hypothetical protein Tco_0051729 [Tanacetum coccineum]
MKLNDKTRGCNSAVDPFLDPRRGAQFYYPSCNVRYEDYRFFNNAVVIAPPSPPPSQSSLSPPSPPPEGNEAIVVRSTSMMLPAFVAWQPRLSLSSYVIPIRNVDWYMFRGDVRSSGSRAPCGRVQAMLPADRLMSGRLRFLWAFGVFSVRAENVTRLVWASRTLLGTRIIATVHIPLFPSLDERCGHVSSSWLSSPCSSIYTVTSVLTQRELALLCSTYNISAELQPELPDRNSTIKDSPEGKIGMYTRFIEFANYWIPLSKFLLCVLEYYQISLS